MGDIKQGTALATAAPLITSQIYALLPKIKRQDADDLRQDLFIKVIEALPEYDPTRAQLSTWLFVVIRNGITDYARRLNTGPKLVRYNHEKHDMPGAEDQHDQSARTGRLTAHVPRHQPTARQSAAIIALTSGEQKQVVAQRLGMRPDSFSQLLARVRERVNDVRPIEEMLKPAARPRITSREKAQASRTAQGPIEAVALLPKAAAFFIRGRNGTGHPSAGRGARAGQHRHGTAAGSSARPATR